ncbi:MAG TPA: polyphenol oxidase family protein [Acidimicrobiales bacterium]
MPTEVTLIAQARGRLSVYPIEFARHFGVHAFVTDRFGGVSAAPYDSLNLGSHVGDDLANVTENRRRVAEAIGVRSDRLVIIHQDHGTAVVAAHEATPESTGDVIMDYGDGFALAILVADCVPLLFVDEDSPRLSLVHAGWKGLAAGVLRSAMSNFEHPDSVHVFLGPSISPEAYQVGPEVAEEFAKVPGALQPDGGDRSRLDLRHVAVSQLMELGVTDERITRSRQTTDGGETFYSDRAQRPCGRFALVAQRVTT